MPLIWICTYKLTAFADNSQLIQFWYICLFSSWTARFSLYSLILSSKVKILSFNCILSISISSSKALSENFLSLDSLQLKVFFNKPGKLLWSTLNFLWGFIRDRLGCFDKLLKLWKYHHAHISFANIFFVQLFIL